MRNVVTGSIEVHLLTKIENILKCIQEDARESSLSDFSNEDLLAELIDRLGIDNE